MSSLSSSSFAGEESGDPNCSNDITTLTMRAATEVRAMATAPRLAPRPRTYPRSASKTTRTSSFAGNGSETSANNTNNNNTQAGGGGVDGCSDDVSTAMMPTAADTSTFASLTNPDELDALICLLPPRLRATLQEHPRRLQLLEVVLDLGRRPLARFADGDVVLSDNVLDYDDIASALENVGDVGADNRAGINRTLHRISVIRNRAGAVVGRGMGRGRGRRVVSVHC